MDDPHTQPMQESAKVLAILNGWQAADFRGYVIAEKRIIRRDVVRLLFAKLAAGGPTVRGVLLVADDMARRQWARYLEESPPHLPPGWVIETPEAALAGGAQFDSDSIVVADELESYLTNDVASAITGARAILGLCASPKGLGETTQLRKYVGRSLDLHHYDGALDLAVLAEQSALRRDLGDLRERLLTVNDPEDLLGYYLTLTQKVSLLSSNEEIALAKQIEAGILAEELLMGEAGSWWGQTPSREEELQELSRLGAAATERFLVSNLRLVYSVARSYSRRMDIMDLIQEGNIGLIRAVQKFDYTLGYKFSTYAMWWIRQAITRAIADQAYLIRIPVHLHESDGPVVKEWRRRERDGDSTETKDIASALGAEHANVQAALGRYRPPYSLERMSAAQIDIIDSHADSFHEYVSLSFLREQLRSMLDTITEREAGVLSLRHGLTDGEPKTLDEIGKVYGVTRERIRQIESKALAKMRHPSRSPMLRDYFTGIVDEELFRKD